MTAATEVVHPLTAVEASLVRTVGEYRDRERQRLEVEWQKVTQEGNARIAPVLRAHGLGEGDTFEIRDDATSATGLAVAITKGAAPAASTPVTPMNRTQRRQLQKEIGTKAKTGGRR
jgi:hypothetical protein